MTLLAFALFWRVHQQHTPANYVLMSWLGIFCVFVIMLFLIRTGYILYVPWLYRLPSPVYYLAFPAAWIYVRMVLKDETKLRKTDYLHALPALLHLVEMVPYYFSSYDHKIEVVSADLVNPLGGFKLAEGWMPFYVHNMMRCIQAVAYAIAMWILIWNYHRANEAAASTFGKVLQWVKTIAVVQFVLGCSILILLVFDNIGTQDLRGTLIYVLFAFYSTLWSTYLVLNPSILGAIPRLSVAAHHRLKKYSSGDNAVTEDYLDENDTIKIAATTKLSNTSPPANGELLVKKGPAIMSLPEEYETYVNRLQQFMDERKPYLEPRYSMSKLAIDLQIPKHHLTYLLNQVLNARFTDYINQQRISYLQQMIANGALKNHTLEALALEAGFNSRITFIRAVQRATGQNPSEFFKEETAGNQA
jgi:AraC-like DNA-binding protein